MKNIQRVFLFGLSLLLILVPLRIAGAQVDGAQDPHHTSG